MKTKIGKIPCFTLTACILCFSTLAAAQSNTLKTESIDYLEKKMLYTKPKIITNNWYDYKRGIFVANREKKHVLLSFCSRTSSYCLKLEENTYANPAVKRLLEEKFVTVKVNGEASNKMIINNKIMTEKDLMKQYEIEGYPTMAFLDSDGKKVSGAIKGYLPPEKFIIVLKYISSDSYKSINFKDYMHREERNTGK